MTRDAATLTLYEATIPRFLQTTAAMAGILARGRSFCDETGFDPEDLAEARLHPDMKPLRFQIRAAIHFSIGSLDALTTGTLGIPNDPTFYDYSGLEALVATSLHRLETIVPSMIDDYAAASIVFAAGERRPRFTGKGLLLSFALAEPVFSRDHGLRHPAYERRAARQARLSRTSRFGGVRSADGRSASRNNPPRLRTVKVQRTPLTYRRRPFRSRNGPARHDCLRHSRAHPTARARPRSSAGCRKA